MEQEIAFLMAEVKSEDGCRYAVTVERARSFDPYPWQVDIENTDTGKTGGYHYVDGETIFEALSHAVKLVKNLQG